MIIDVNIEEIIVQNRLREVDTNSIETLKDSIDRQGLINAITINQDNILIAGYHRYTACKQLNHKTIQCKVIDTKSNDEMQLLEIDENLLRVELHYLDLSEQLKLRKEIYERLYSDTVLGATGRGRSKNNKSFVDDITEKINKSKSSIYNLLSITDKLSSDEKKTIKELDISQTDTKSLINMDIVYRQEVLNTMSEKSLNLKDTIKHLKEKRNSELAESINKSFNDKSLDSVQFGDTIEIIKNMSDDIKYDCFYVDINAYSENTKEQLEQIEEFLENVDSVMHDKSILFFFSNETIDNKLEAKLINKFNRVERMFYRINNVNQDSLFDDMRDITLYVCRNFENTEKICLGMNSNLFKNELIKTIVENTSFNNLSIFEPYTSNDDLYRYCVLSELDYFGICQDKETFISFEKVVDLTQYFDENFLDFYTSFDFSNHLSDAIFSKNLIYVSNDNEKFLLKVDNKANEKFNSFELYKSWINDIINLTTENKNSKFKILLYKNEIYFSMNKNFKRISSITPNYDNQKSVKKFFINDLSDKEKIEFTSSDILNVNDFDIYVHSKRENFQYFIAVSKTNKNLQVRFRQEIELQKV